jgi:hypothetical protein
MRRKRMSKRRQRGGFLEGLTSAISNAFGFGSGNSGASSSTQNQNSNVSAETVAKQMDGENDQPAEIPAPPANENIGQTIPAQGLQAGGKRTRRSKASRRGTQRRRRRASSRKAGKK